MAPSRVELAEMLQIPGIEHPLPVLGLQADRAGYEDLCHLKRALPLRRELVHALQILDLAQHKISYLELPGTDVPAVIAAKCLLIASGPHNCPATNLLEKVDIINPLSLL